MDTLKYEQPTKYIVNSTEYVNNGIPVLTAGKSFILGHTNEQKGIYDKGNCIIFDDFTTSSKFVDFKFKVKSSALKILTPLNDKYDLKFLYYMMNYIKFVATDHQRHWISIYSKFYINCPEIEEQKEISKVLSNIDDLIYSIKKLIDKKEKIKFGTMCDLLKDGNTKKSYNDIFTTYSTLKHEISASNYLSNGKYKIIDQGKSKIAGYTNDINKLVDTEGIIVFGDHTCEVKYPNEPFAVGADGVKLIKIKTEDVCPKYMYYYLKLNGVKPTGYNRHFKYIKEMDFNIINNLQKQQEIANILTDMDNEIDLLNQKLDKYEKIKAGMMEELLTGKVRLNYE